VPILAGEDDRLQELVRLVLLIPGLDGLDCVVRRLAFALHEPVHGDRDALPTLVAVHRVVPASDARYLADADLAEERGEVLRIARGGLGRGVAAVAKEVDVDVRDTLLLRGLEERLQVVDVRVHAAVGNLPASPP
jgi:hypothetical protein